MQMKKMAARKSGIFVGAAGCGGQVYLLGPLTAFVWTPHSAQGDIRWKSEVRSRIAEVRSQKHELKMQK
jgi:hypothetical protein